MSLTQDQLNRAELPVVTFLGVPDDPETWDYLDACHLHRQGLIDPSLMAWEGQIDVPAGALAPQRFVSAEKWAKVQAILDTTGQRGAYEAHVRATGIVHVCPDWCPADDHPRAGIYDLEAPEEAVIAHTRDLWTLNTEEDEPKSEVHIALERWEGYREADKGTNLYLHAEAPMTAAQARQVAAALLDAADTLDGMTP